MLGHNENPQVNRSVADHTQVVTKTLVKNVWLRDQEGAISP